MDLDEETYAIINANNEAAKKVESFRAVDPKREDILSLASVLSQRGQIGVLAAKMRRRHEIGMAKMLSHANPEGDASPSQIEGKTP
jgi:hypothetical protein